MTLCTILHSSPTNCQKSEKDQELEPKQLKETEIELIFMHHFLWILHIALLYAQFHRSFQGILAIGHVFSSEPSQVPAKKLSYEHEIHQM